MTGIGKSAMAAGLAYTLALYSHQKSPILINVGIAGHQKAELNEVFFADKITDADTKKSYYPQLVFDVPSQTSLIISVSSPEQDYQPDCLYDMEASAFFETAMRFSTSELIHSIKVISDNACSPPTNITPQQVSIRLQGCITILVKCLEQLTPLALSLIENEPEDYQKYLHKWHFTVSAQQQLKQLLNQWDLLANGKKPLLDLTSIKTAKELLRQLENQLNELKFTI